MQVFKRRRAPSLIPYLLESPGISFNVIHHDASAFPPCVKRSFWKHLAAPGYARTRSGFIGCVISDARCVYFLVTVS